MARTLEFYFHYGSPYSYLADTPVEAIAQRAGARLVRKPMLLGGVFKATANASPMAVPLKSKWAGSDMPMWIDGCNLNEMSEVAKVLTAAGIDAARIGNHMQDQDVKDRLKATTAHRPASWGT